VNIKTKLSLYIFIFLLSSLGLINHASAATSIYRSVGVGATSPLAAGTGNNLTISGTTGTFATAPGTTIGVGDAIQYDDDGDSDIDADDSVVFITARLSSTTYTVQKADGTAPTAVTNDQDWSIYRSYISLFNAEAGIENTGIDSDLRNFDDWTAGGEATTDDVGKDIAAADMVWNIACYANGTAADTTAVNVTGWTTDGTRYVKIYTPYLPTEVGVSQRHSGKWDDNKYHIVYDTTNTGGTTVSVNTNKVDIDGLQIKRSDTTHNDTYGINVGTGYSIGNTISMNFSNNIITRGANSHLGGAIGAGGNYSYLNIWNNIIYGQTNASTSYTAIGAGGWGEKLYIYNNTLFNNAYAIYIRSSAALTAKAVNNIFKSNTTDASGPFVSGTGYNATNNIGIGYTVTGGDPVTDRLGTDGTVTFVSETGGSEDLHLASTDTGAKNYGTDLSSDANVAFWTDAEGQPRPYNSGSWDIGADEQGGINVFYSVSGGADTSTDRKTTATVQISKGVMIFSAAQAGNIGVGDEVTYGTSKKVYLANKVDSTHWNVVTIQGRVPEDIAAGTTLDSIKRIWSTLNGALAGSDGANYLNTGDLVAGNYILNLPCYYDTGADTTAASTTSDYTTGAGNYIKIYTPNNTSTEANFSQRHEGKWDDAKYRLETSTNASSISVTSDYAQIDGLQVQLPQAASYKTAIGNAGSGTHTISNNIIRAVAAQTSQIGIDSSGTVIMKAYNNVIYNFVGTTNRGIYKNSTNSTYIYNNTIINCVTGISVNSGNIVAKNNIAYNNTDNYSGSFDASSTNNLSGPSSDSTISGQSYPQNGVTVDFVDTANKDFHLAASDTAARNNGADLSADANLAVTTDIDGHTRSAASHSGAFDIGADEGATHIYYSAGQNTDDHMTGSPTIEVSGYTATLNVGQTAANMGVGDKITYTGGSCYITGKTSSTVWSCQNVTGGTAPQVAAGTSVTSVAHVFSSLNQAIGVGGSAPDSAHLNTADLKTNNYVLNIPCYNDAGAADTTAVTINAYTTAQPNYLKVYTPNNTTSEANVSQRHAGKWDTSKYYMSIAATGIAVIVSEEFVKIDGLQIYSLGGSGWQHVIYAGASGVSSDIQISNNILYSPTNTNKSGIVMGNANITARIWNNVIYDFAYAGAESVAINISAAKNVYIYNNTIYNCYYGIKNDSATATIYTKNNMINATRPAGAFDGTFTDDDAYNDYNMVTDGSAYAALGSHGNYSQTFNFTDAANKDFHITNNNIALINAGADLSADANFAFSTDIDGQTRANGKWDIGADENNNVVIEVKRGVNFGKGVIFK